MSEAPGKLGWSYSGIAWTNRDGVATVSLPELARVHEHGFEYELEAIGSDSRVELAHGVADDRFRIVSDDPHVRVAWRATPYRAAATGATTKGDADHRSAPEVTG